MKYLYPLDIGIFDILRGFINIWITILKLSHNIIIRQFGNNWFSIIFDDMLS